jgi:hypothetical protein
MKFTVTFNTEHESPKPFQISVDGNWLLYLSLKEALLLQHDLARATDEFKQQYFRKTPVND